MPYELARVIDIAAPQSGLLTDVSLRAAFHRHFPHRPQIGPLTRGTRQYTLPHQINREVNIITFLVILALNLGNYPRIWPSTILIYG